jgi:outer membrane lipoprotein-sorting protein
MTFFVLIFLFPLSLTFLYAITGKEIVERSDRAVRGDTQIAQYAITIKTRRWTRTMEMTGWDNRALKKSFSEITSPKKDAGNRFLLMDKNMWHFVPKLQKVIRVSPSMTLQSWMGSDFTNDDIVKESSIVEDYTHELLGKETVGGNECYKVQLNPKPDSAVVWGKIVYYARVSDYLPVKEEFYNEHGVLKKVMTCWDFKMMHNRVVPAKYKMQTVSTPEKFTLMEIRDIRFDVPIKAGTFSMQNLQRR